MSNSILKKHVFCLLDENNKHVQIIPGKQTRIVNQRITESWRKVPINHLYKTRIDKKTRKAVIDNRLDDKNIKKFFRAFHHKTGLTTVQYAAEQKRLHHA